MTNLEAINAIRTKLGMATKPVEVEKGIRCKRDSFYWGGPDGADTFHDGWSVFYEIEKGQQHPCTNVLKYWPVMEEDPSLKIILVQWLIQAPKSKNRWELSKFLGDKLMHTFPDRFQYIYLEMDAVANSNKLSRFQIQYSLHP